MLSCRSQIAHFARHRARGGFRPSSEIAFWHAAGVEKSASARQSRYSRPLLPAATIVHTKRIVAIISSLATSVA